MKQIEKYRINENGEIVNLNTGRLLKTDMNSAGYHRVTLCINGEVKRHFVHRLVCQLYVADPSGYDVNHKDGNKTNNHYSNLEVVTRQFNIQHSIDTGLRKIGDSCYNATITNTQVEHVCELLQQGLVRGEILKLTGIKKHTFDGIRTGKRWKHISKNYTWQKRSTTIESTA